jgi:hypothetical protein
VTRAQHLAAIASSGNSWRPAQATSAPLVGWYESRADLITTGTGGVSQINNRLVGGSNPLLQAADASQRPDLEIAGWGVGSADSVLFNGATDVLTANGLGSLVSGTDVGFSVLWLGQIVTLGSAAGNRTIWGFGNTGTDTPVFDFRLPSSTTAVGNVTRRDDSNALRTKNLATPLDTARHLYSFIYDGARGAFWIDDTLDANLDGAGSGADLDLGASTFNTFTLGGLTRTGSAAQSNIRHGGLLVFGGPLSPADFARAKRYLKLGHPL